MAEIIGYIMANPDAISVMFVGAVAVSAAVYLVMQRIMLKGKWGGGNESWREPVDQRFKAAESSIDELVRKVDGIMVTLTQTQGPTIAMGMADERIRRQRIREAPQMKAEDVTNLLRGKLIEAIQNADFGVNLDVAFDEKLEVKPSGTLKVKTREIAASPSASPSPQEAQQEGEGIGAGI